MRQRLALLGAVLAAIVLAVGVLLGFVYSGFYNVAATEDHTGLTEWTFETVTERSIRRYAAELPTPLPTDSAVLMHGFEHYRLMCEVCHGGVGIDRSEIAAGLNPRPPRLSRAARKWSDEELFWVIKHGIRSTGMPAFGPTHSDESLLEIVAVVRQLPDMTAEEYAARIAASQGLDHGTLMGDSAEANPAAPAPAGHTHAPGTPPHSH